MKAYSYVRFSSDKQQWGDSEKRQEQLSKAWCARKGIALADMVADRGVSAKTGGNRTHGAFAELLKVVKAGDYILIEDNDRFGRDEAITAMQALKEICAKGITIVFLRTGIEVNSTNFNDPAIIIPNFFSAFLANQENVKKSERVGKAWATKRKAAANGKTVTCMVPAWVDVDEKTGVRTANKKRKIVERIFEDYAGGKPIRTIVKELNAEKVRPFGKGNQNKGNGWSSTSVHRYLGSRSVLGEYQPYKRVNKKSVADGQPVPDYYPPIIRPELFYKCQEILGRNKNVGGVKTNATNLLTGIVKCAHCGGSMNIKYSPHKQGKYVYTLLFCSNANNNTKCTHKNKIQYGHVERAVLTLLWSKVIPLMQDGNKRADELATAKGELESVEKVIERLTNAIALTDNTMPQAMVNKIHESEARAKILKSKIEELEALGNDNALLDWEPCIPNVSNRLRMQNILRGEIKSLTINAGARSAVLTLNDPNVSFAITWDYQRANQVKKNPADSGFILSDLSGGETNKKMVYQDELFVWRTANTPNIRIAVA